MRNWSMLLLQSRAVRRKRRFLNWCQVCPASNGFWLLTHGVLAGSSSSSSNPLMESSAEEERLREVPLPGSVRGQRAIHGKRFQPYSYRKAPGHFPVDARHLGVEQEHRRNERRLRRESAAFSGYAASSSDDSLGTTDRSCRGCPDDPKVGSGQGAAVSDDPGLASSDGGQREVQSTAVLPPHAFCSFHAGRRYGNRREVDAASRGHSTSRDR